MIPLNGEPLLFNLFIIASIFLEICIHFLIVNVRIFCLCSTKKTLHRQAYSYSNLRAHITDICSLQIRA